MPWIAAAAAIAQGAAALVGSANSAADKQKATDATNNALAQIQALGAPPDLAKQLILNKFSQSGVLTPEVQKQVQLGPSAVSQIQTNPQLLQAQMQALQQMQQQSQSGMSPADQAAYQQLKNQIAQQTQGQQQAVLQSYAARGESGAGNELAAQLLAGQAGANQAQTSGNQIAGAASQRALEALSNAGNMASQLQGQQFDINRIKASAADQVNQFNAQNAIQTQAANVNAANAAQQYNLANAQGLSNMNTQAANQELQRQNAAQQQDWQNQVALAKLKAGSNQEAANTYNAYGQQTAQQAQNVGSGLAGVATSLMGAAAKNPNLFDQKPATSGQGGDTSSFNNLFTQLGSAPTSGS